jgi:hypothetical protein
MIRIKFFALDRATKSMVTSSFIILMDENMLGEKVEAQRVVIQRAMPSCTVVALIETGEFV